MKTAILCAMLASACLAGRVETVSVDLGRAQTAFSIQVTEATDAEIRVGLKSGGADFDAAGWTGLLWYGTTIGGHTVTNSMLDSCSMTFAISSANMPTNGRYSALLMGSISNRVEEWSRGSVTVRQNLAADYLPVQWGTNVGFYAYAVAALTQSAQTKLDLERLAALTNATITIGSETRRIWDSPTFVLSGGTNHVEAVEYAPGKYRLNLITP